MKKPYVLITNDDGIRSPGLIALAESIQPYSDILIVAPKMQQTNMGRGSLSDFKTGIIEKEKINVNGQLVDAYAVYGSPAQAVAHAVMELADKAIDFCLSGINYGENLGLAFTCSGTLGACFEADSMNIASIAFSRKISMKKQRSDDFDAIDWEGIKHHIKDIYLNIYNNGFPDGIRILNVNFPENVQVSTEVRVTRQAYMNYGKYIKTKNRDISKAHRMEWTLNDKLNEAPIDSDIHAIHKDKVISVTPLQSIMSVDSNTYYRKNV